MLPISSIPAPTWSGETYNNLVSHYWYRCNTSHPGLGWLVETWLVAHKWLGLGWSIETWFLARSWLNEITGCCKLSFSQTKARQNFPVQQPQSIVCSAYVLASHWPSGPWLGPDVDGLKRNKFVSSMWVSKCACHMLPCSAHALPTLLWHPLVEQSQAGRAGRVPGGWDNLIDIRFNTTQFWVSQCNLKAN